MNNKIISTVASDILIVLKYLIPRPSPDHAEIINKAVAIAKIIIWNKNDLGKSNKYVKPLLICAEPKPSVEATPTIVANTARVSIRVPVNPRIRFSPSKGINVALINPGAPIRNLKYEIGRASCRDRVKIEVSGVEREETEKR